MTCDERKQKIRCPSLPYIQLVSALINRLPSVFWVKRCLMDEGGCSGILTFFYATESAHWTSNSEVKCPCNATERCLRELDLSTWLLLSQFIFCTTECAAEPFRHCCTADILQWRWLALIPASHNCCKTVRSGAHLNCYRSCYHSTMPVNFRQDSGYLGCHHFLYFA